MAYIYEYYLPEYGNKLLNYIFFLNFILLNSNSYIIILGFTFIINVNNDFKNLVNVEI